MRYQKFSNAQPWMIGNRGTRPSPKFYELYRIMDDLDDGESAFLYRDDCWEGLTRMRSSISAWLAKWKRDNPKAVAGCRTDRERDGMWVFKNPPRPGIPEMDSMDTTPLVRPVPEKPAIPASGVEYQMLRFMMDHDGRLNAMQYRHLPPDIRGKDRATKCMRLLMKRGIAKVSAYNKDGEPKQWDLQ